MIRARQLHCQKTWSCANFILRSFVTCRLSAKQFLTHVACSRRIAKTQSFANRALRYSLSFSLDSQRAHPPVKVTAVDSHQLSRPRDVAFGLVKLSLNEFAVIS